MQNPLGITGSKVIVPGDTNKSILFRRVSIVGQNQMPPLARNVVDTNAVAAIGRWILSLHNTIASLPKNWIDADIGNVGSAGEASALNGIFNLIASGDDIWDVADSFHFAGRPLTGDGQIVARVTSLQFTDPWAKAGVMFRENLTPGSRHALMVVTAGDGSAFQRRETADKPSGNTDGPATKTPYWVKLVRTGDMFTGYLSADGKNWQRVDSVMIPMGKTIYVGLALTAHNNSALNSSLFDNVVVASVGELLAARKNYPAHWWTPVPTNGAPAWEILPQVAAPDEVILSKRNELGLLSNFAPTPFTFHGQRYASLEGFWQMMKYAENTNDSRATFPNLTWPYTREQVSQLTSFDAKHAGDVAEANMKTMGIDWVTFEGRQMEYHAAGESDFYKLIVAATREKVRQNPDVQKVLLATGDLILMPDHHQETNMPAAWHYFEILTQIRSELQANGKLRDN